MKRIAIFSVFALWLSQALAVPVTSPQEAFEHFRKAGFSGVAGFYGPEKRFDLANGMEGERPVNAADPFVIGSVTKQFTAVAILKLAEAGKLSVQDPVQKFFPEFKRGDVTLHHLLSHTSGIPDIVGSDFFKAIRVRPFTGLEPLIPEIAKQEPEFEAGKNWSYSNSNYLLLSRIVEIASGESWWSYVRRNLILPAGMTSTTFPSGRGPTVVSTYEAGRDYEKIPIEGDIWNERNWASGAGGLESTTADLARWNEALFGGRLLSQASLEAMTTPHEPSSTDVGYGYGIIAARTAWGERVFIHSGGILGFASWLAYYPERKTTIAVLTNFRVSEPHSLARALASIEFKGSAEVASLVDVEPLPTGLERFAGTFVSEEVPLDFVIVAENGRLYLHHVAHKSQGDEISTPYRLVIRGPGTFYERSLALDLAFDEGSIDRFTVDIEGTDSTFTRKP